MENRGIRKDSADIIMSRWRERTKKCYHSFIKKWIKHYDEKSKDSFRPTADELTVFLTSLYNQGKGYSCVNLARSAVTTLSLGSMHPLVNKFVRGVFNRRPAFPRNTVMWDTDIVFKFLKWSPAANLSLPQLTLKVVLLCVLVLARGVRPYGCWIYATLLGQRQTFDARLEISSRFPFQTDIRTHLCLEAFLKINPCVWCTT